MEEDRAPKVVKPPPKRDDKPPPSSNGPGRPKGTANRGTVANIENTITEFLNGVALAFSFQGNDVCAVVFTHRGPKVAAAWAELARQNPNVRKTLERLMQGGAWGGVAISTISLLMPIGQYYEVIPANIPIFALSREEQEHIIRIRAAKETPVTSNGTD